MTDTEKLLAGLAAVWVGRWLKYGGGLIVDPNCDRLQVSMGLDWRRKPTGTEPWERQQRLWHDGWVVGRWRELGELCEAVPGLRDAIIHHVALHGQERACGSRVMYAT